MATRLKTVEYAFPELATLADATLTALTGITIYIPEGAGTITFRKVVAHMTADEAGTTSFGGVGTRTIQLSLNGAAAAVVSNTNAITTSGENVTIAHAGDFTAHFTANWGAGATSRTLACSVNLDDQATAGQGWRNVNVIVSITYEYDDTQATQIKTIRIPLDAPVGTLATTKPGSATATIPALSTELPEASKVIRSAYIVVQGNMNNTGSTTDGTLSMQLDSTAAYTSGTIEATQTSDRWQRFVFDCSAVLNPAISMGFYIWASQARHNHMQAWLVVTYEFDATQETDVFVSVMLPIDAASPMGTSNTIWQRMERELFIQEAATVTQKQVALYLFWEQAAPTATVAMRLGTGSFVTYTDGASALGGANGCMIRDDTALTLARGRNRLQADIYTTDTSDFGFNLSGFWIVNYTAGKPAAGAGGYGACNHTVSWNLGAVYDSTSGVNRILTAVAPIIPETDFYIVAMGLRFEYFSSGTVTPGGILILAERLAAGEGGLSWEEAYTDVTTTDPETGIRFCWAQIKDLFKRWPGDDFTNRMDIESARRWRIVKGNAANAWDYLDLMFTYHTITYSVAGEITGSGGGTVTIDLHRESTGEMVKSTTRVGNGAYSFTWYDNTEDIFVSCHEDATHLGRSAAGLAGT